MKTGRPARFIALMLLTAMLAVSMFTGCSDEPETGAVTEAAATETAAAESTDEFPYPDAAGKDYGGYEFSILYFEWGLYNNYFFATEESGDAVNDALYKRYRTVEEKAGVTFGFIALDGATPGGIYKNMRQSVSAGSDDYDLALTHCYDGVAPMATEGIVYDWNKLPFVDFTQPYWNQTMNDSLSIKGMLPFAASDYMISDPNAIFFNKNMVRKYNIEDPYALVTGGGWTWDKLAETASVASDDINGDGVYDISDQYGFMGELDWQFIGIQHACGEFIITKDEEGYPRLTENFDKLTSIVDKIFALVHNDNISYTWNYSSAYDPNLGNPPPVSFSDDRALFYLVPLNSAKVYRSTEVDFGILPFPKYDDAQEKYISLNWSGVMAIPATASDPERTGVVIELLSAEGRKNFLPVFYDIMLSTKVARDDESADMLDIIYNNCVYDIGLNYNAGNILYMMPQILKKSSPDVASFYETNRKAAEESMKKLYEAIEAE